MRRIAIVGGGIAGLAAAYELAALARAGAAVEAVLFESSNRFGGLIETVREGGFTVECGPDAWVTAKPWARELAIALGLEAELIASNDDARKTWLWLSTPGDSAHRLVPMPDGFNMMVPASLEALAALDRSPLFTAAAIAAYRAEPGRADELRAAIPSNDESVADFTLRHFGTEVLDRIAAPLLSGVFGGDVQRLSVRAVMPAFVQMEREHGSLIAALAAARAPTAPIFTTLRSGLVTLIDRLVAAVPATWLHLNTAVTALEPTPNIVAPSSQLLAHGSQHVGKIKIASPERPRWTVSTSTTANRFASESFDAVLLATPLNAARSLLAPIDPTAAQLLPSESSSAVLVAFCFPDAARVPLPPGFGFLVPPPVATQAGAPQPALNLPRGLGSDMPPTLLLACTFADQKFPHRVPPGGRLIRAFFGGAAADRLARCNNDEIAAIARLELARILNSGAPVSGPAPTPLPASVLTVVRRWPASLPQYAVGHLDRVAEFESRLSSLSGLTLLGNALHGVGLPDLIRAAVRSAATSHGT
jgi:protoporphyrinogen/coproporphyrinogen III oxidase